MILLYWLVNNDIGMDFGDFFYHLLSHFNKRSYIYTNFINLIQPAEQDVTFSPQERLTAGMVCQRMLVQQVLSMNLRAN